MVRALALGRYETMASAQYLCRPIGDAPGRGFFLLPAHKETRLEEAGSLRRCGTLVHCQMSLEVFPKRRKRKIKTRIRKRMRSKRKSMI